MFEYNVRTEIAQGARFVEKDILLFDYGYAGDILLQTDVTLVTSGYGFVIAEDDHTGSGFPVIYLIKINSDDSYCIIQKTSDGQQTVDNGFFVSATRIYSEQNVILFFRKEENKLLVNKAVRQEDGRYEEIPLIIYHLSHDIEDYKVGIYSNGGNTVTFASISTEAPSNWITNVFNANGGRIKWIRNGFIIDEAEYDIEAEAENIELKAGTYYFAYETDNPDMKAYIYLTYRKHTDEKRPREEIIKTRMDEIKNILQEDGSFTIPEDHAINIKFKGKWGTVKNICVKLEKDADFVETSYGNYYRPPGRILFNLSRINEIRIRAAVKAIPKQDLSKPWRYHLFQRDDNFVVLEPPIQLEEENEYTFITATNTLSINGEPFKTLTGGDILSAFFNVTARITELIIVTNKREEVNVLLQKTFRRMISGNITSPIIITHTNDAPLDLSSSYRQVITQESATEVFHSYNPIRLSHTPVLSNAKIKLYGVLSGVPLYQSNGSFTDDKVLISYVPSKQEILQGTIRLPSAIKLRYRWILVEYNAVSETKYVFTPWERETFDLTESGQVYLEHTPLDTDGSIVIYGIKDKSHVNTDHLYYTDSPYAENIVDLCCTEYTVIPSSQYYLTLANKVILDTDVTNEFSYLIIDYLKDDCYAVNHTGQYWEIEISSRSNEYKMIYDSVDGLVTTPFKLLDFTEMKNKNDNDIEEDDFIVLEAGA